MLKKENVYVKLTKKNIDEVISIVKELIPGYDKPGMSSFLDDVKMWVRVGSSTMYFKYINHDEVEEDVGEWKGGWGFSTFPEVPHSTDRISIKPKQLREILLKEVANSREAKQLEVGKWYKRPCYTNSRFMFKFNGEFGNGVTIGFSSNGRYLKKVGVLKMLIGEYEEATPEEVVKAFEYHFENFDN